MQYLQIPAAGRRGAEIPAAARFAQLARVAWLWPLLLVMGGSAATLAAAQEDSAAEPEPQRIVEALVVDRVGRGGRAPVHTSAVEWALATGDWSPPSPGTPVMLPDGTMRSWRPITAGEAGVFADEALRGGYLYASVHADESRVALLHAVGHSAVWVNGRPRAGDPYRTWLVRLPIRLRAGRNDLLFKCSRGSLRVSLSDPPGPVFIGGDPTLPDVLLAGDDVAAGASELVGGVLVVNASEAPAGPLVLVAQCSGGRPTRTVLPPIPPLTFRKVAFTFQPPTDLTGAAVELTVQVQPGHAVEGGDEGGREETAGNGASAAAAERRSPPSYTPVDHAVPETVLDAAAYTLAVRSPRDTHRRTFVSELDGSVQYYALVPASAPPGGQGEHAAPDEVAPAAPAIVLSLHGASVEAFGQAGAYEAKPWCHIVAPTNRRPFGFDWEDWGRLDALEVLALAQDALPHDPQRVHVTGHSMGGHGAWHLGVTFPDRFATVAPSAGWISFRSYGGAVRFDRDDPVQSVMARAVSMSNTLMLLDNLAQSGVYVLHGDADDNVPVREARRMRERLGRFHPDFAYHEQPGAGHWWGRTCVDWPPLMDFIRRRHAPADDEADAFAFTTASPGVSADCHWLRIGAQSRQLELSTVHAQRVRDDAGEVVRLEVETDNVARLSIDGRAVGGDGERAVTVVLDGATLKAAGPERIYFERAQGEWRRADAPAVRDKGPHRYGTFKDVFRHRPVLVYGTRGSDEADAWAFAKARFDAETFWYRGNGVLELMSDDTFLASDIDADRNVILYGNASTNGAWSTLLGDSPVQIRPDAVAIGDETLDGDDLACLLIRPRPGSRTACVGVVGGTGPAARRAADTLPYFVSGVGYPDVTVISAEAFRIGLAGIRAAGFFGLDWSVDGGMFVMDERAR